MRDPTSQTYQGIIGVTANGLHVLEHVSKAQLNGIQEHCSCLRSPSTGILIPTEKKIPLRIGLWGQVSGNHLQSVHSSLVQRLVSSTRSKHGSDASGIRVVVVKGLQTDIRASRSRHTSDTKLRSVLVVHVSNL